MPPKCYPPSLEETLAALNENLSKLNANSSTNTTNTEKLIAGQATSQSQIDIVIKQLAAQYEQTNALITHITKTERNNTPPPPLPNNNGLQLRSPKLSLPNFDGTKPLDWLFQADQYFSFYNIAPPQRLAMVSFYLTGDALSWHKYLYNNRLLTTWEAFTRALETRFGPSTYDNHQAALFKLRQTTTVSDYQTEFERLSNCVVGLTTEVLLNCFISGLRRDIQQELSILKPQTITQAIGLAKLIEDKLNDQPTYDVNPTPLTPPNPSVLVPSSSTPPTLPVKRLNPTEMQKRRAEGLCFNCPEKYHHGHQCNPPKFLILQSAHEPPWSYATLNDQGLEDKAFV